MFRQSTLLALLVLLTACSDSDAPTPAESGHSAAEPATSSTPPDDTVTIAPQAVSHGVTEFVFRCSDGSEFTVSYGDQLALLTLDDAQHQLRQQPTASGARYSDEQLEFYNKGDEAILIIADVSHDCAALDRQQQRLPGPDLIAPDQAAP